MDTAPCLSFQRCNPESLVPVQRYARLVSLTALFEAFQKRLPTETFRNMRGSKLHGPQHEVEQVTWSRNYSRPIGE
jgi:hypothetical protein